MTNEKLQKTSKRFSCDTCNFICRNKQDYTRHLSTAKHKLRSNTNEKLQKTPNVYQCICGRKYNHASSLWNHKKKCLVSQGPNTDGSPTNLINSIVSSENEDTRDELIERLVTSNAEIVTSSNEMKSMFQLLLEKYQESQLQNQELMSKMIDVMPQMGNTTNNNSHNNTTNNNTLNFYLTNTCKDAESIHDFTERFVKRSVDFFKGNYLDVAHNQIDLASNVYDIFKNCLDENPQTKKFVQTTDAKNGVLYIKEKQKDENKQLCGEAEFIKHMDGFEKAGTNISHAINCAFIPVQDNYKEIMERECGKEPKEDDYEDEDHYERDMDIYKEKTGDLKRHLLIQSFNAVCLFDAKKRRNEVLEKTRRLKE
jgi:uncharacterized C2H2 Zn-finger protein